MSVVNVWFIETGRGVMAAARTARGLCALTLPHPDRDQALEHILNFRRTGFHLVISKPDPREPEYHLERTLQLYFAGVRVDLDFPVDWSVFTPFQQKVLQVVKSIPYGSLWSYREVAVAAGNPRALRATGGALAANRVLLVVPCHRVVCSDGRLGGFSGAAGWKEVLLELEGCPRGPDGRFILSRLGR